MLRAVIHPSGAINVSRVKEKPLQPLKQELELTEQQQWDKVSLKYHGLDATVEKRVELGFTGLVNCPQFPESAKAPKQRRGLGGLTRLGASRLRDGAVLIEERFSRWRCAFLTLTVPPDPTREFSSELVLEAYSLFQDELVRMLKSEGCTEWIAGVVEAHPKRSAREGRFVPHFHVLFPGKSSSGQWFRSTDWYRDTWIRCLRAKGVIGYSCETRAATRVEAVTKSVGAYMAKYLSKTSKNSDGKEVEQNKTGIPGSWHRMTRALVRAIKKEIVIVSGKAAERLWDYVKSDCPFTIYWGDVKVEFNGVECWVGGFSVLSKAFRRSPLLMAIKEEERQWRAKLKSVV